MVGNYLVRGFIKYELFISYELHIHLRKCVKKDKKKINK